METVFHFEANYCLYCIMEMKPSKGNFKVGPMNTEMTRLRVSNLMRKGTSNEGRFLK